MSQIFNLRLATDTLAVDAQQLGVTPEQLQHIHVKVSASIIQQPDPQLWLTYSIQLPNADLATQLSWPAWEQAQVSFTDYLWEQTCLECFIAGSNLVLDEVKKTNEAKSYIEINASPNGRYALYYFENYRTPPTLPPTPLLHKDGKLKTDKKSQAHINWSTEPTKPQNIRVSKLLPNNKLTTVINNLTACSFKPRHFYQRSFGVPLNQLPSYISNDSFSNSACIEKLHPCVILRLSDTVLYFASAHASPPDFHNHSYWPLFDYKAALSE
ncbi:hypothetical protein ES754_09995 [Psychrobacter frigidicola]|uniref:DOMON-like domain-containing protein n=1 Tax=Psychrobacter frigidicola TaxID=45611 RepID=A0A5C6ZZQ2_9GAMM|nr:hypothetical protein [Psychrobacter frigidicola]TXD96463.1 hypothetical protein ES754_09995 [Psychrobacter frigidicola]